MTYVLTKILVRINSKNVIWLEDSLFVVNTVNSLKPKIHLNNI
jgi:hypothetical protein